MAYFAPLKKAWRALLFDWRKTAVGRQYDTLPKEQFAGRLKKLIEKLSEGNSKQNLVNGFKACGIHPFNPEEVYRKLPSENTMTTSPSKALDTLANMRGEDAETAQTRPKEKRLDVQPGKSIAENLSSESDESDEESEEDSETEESDTPSTKSLSQKEMLLQTFSEVNKSLDDDKKGRRVLWSKILMGEDATMFCR